MFIDDGYDRHRNAQHEAHQLGQMRELLGTRLIQKATAAELEDAG
ncbi:MAG: hypothetical protein ABWX83_06235 [Luteibacter sp.]